MEYSIINCVSDPVIRQEIDQMAFYRGLSTWNLREFIQKRKFHGTKAVVWYADRDYLTGIPEDVILTFSAQCPLVMLGGKRRQEEIRKEGAALFQDAFRRRLLTFDHLPEWNGRTMAYGRLKICRQSRRVFLDGENVELSGFAYDVFLLLVEHVGEAVSRELINQTLPRRSRSSLRNVDTHIKYIRRQMDWGHVIRCVRSVGYYIPMDEFYRYCTENVSPTDRLRIF